MAVKPTRADRTRPRTPMWPQQLRRPRRWSRLLVAGIALMLLAALGPRAVADEPDVIDGLSSPIDSAVDPAADPPPPVAAAGDGGGDEHGGPVADATTGGWTLTVVLTA